MNKDKTDTKPANALSLIFPMNLAEVGPKMLGIVLENQGLHIFPE
jgi:hypothetical protein